MMLEKFLVNQLEGGGWFRQPEPEMGLRMRGRIWSVPAFAQGGEIRSLTGEHVS
jgi:hypothetical protein